MNLFTCTTCGSRFEHEELPRRGEICFKCHIKGIRIGFTYGKADFHGPTVRERQLKQEADAAAGGIKAEPVGSRWV